MIFDKQTAMKSALLILLIFSGIVLNAQIKELKKQNVKGEFFKLDKLGYFYFAKENVLTKSDKNSNIICTYDDFSNGNISDFDVSDPLRIMIYYHDFNRLIFLDNNLSILRDPVLLDDLDLYNIDAIASSYDGGFWAFDNQLNQMIRINQKLNLAQQGTNLYSVILGESIDEILVSTNFIILKTNGNSIVILDEFANYYMLLELDGAYPICVDNNVLYIMKNQELLSYNLKNKKQTKIPFLIEKITDFEVSGNFIYVLSENSLITFQIL